MLDTIDPVQLSTAENEFLLQHLGEPSVVALRAIHGVLNPKAHPKDKNPIIYPEGVLPSSIKPILDGVYELIELQKHEGLPWIGLDAVKAGIRTWLKQNEKWKADAKRSRNAPRWPSLFSYDGKGRPHIGGPGSDAGTVKTYFGPAGERIPFTIDLVASTNVEWAGPGFTEAPLSTGLHVDPTVNRIECRIKSADGTVCGHTESYKPDSRASYNLARGRMSRHLRKATLEVEAHRELHTNEFGA